MRCAVHTGRHRRERVGGVGPDDQVRVSGADPQCAQASEWCIAVAVCSLAKEAAEHSARVEGRAGEVRPHAIGCVLARVRVVEFAVLQMVPIDVFFQTSSPLEVPIHSVPGRTLKRLVAGMSLSPSC